MHATLADENDDGHHIGNLFEYRRKHQRAKSQRLRSDHEKRDLPGQRGSHESVEEPGMRDRRRVHGEIMANMK